MFPRVSPVIRGNLTSAVLNTLTRPKSRVYIALRILKTSIGYRIIDPEERRRFTFQPGQFLMLEVPGRRRGAFFHLLFAEQPRRHRTLHPQCWESHQLSFTGGTRHARSGIRGPFGTSFPMEEMQGQNIFLIAGGLGLAPLPLAHCLCAGEPEQVFEQVDIIYGTRDPSQLLFTYQYDMWRKDDISLDIIVEKPDTQWKGPVGLTTKILKEKIANGTAH